MKNRRNGQRLLRLPTVIAFVLTTNFPIKGATNDQSPQLPDPTFHIRTWSPNNSDLPSVDVQALVVAHNGEVWVGTANGLARFLDDQWRTFSTKNKELPSDDVTALILAPEGLLWVGTNAGLARFQNGRCGAVGPPQHITALAIAPNGALWVGALEGVSQFHNGQWRTFGEFADPNVRALAVESDGTVWVGTSGRLARFRDNQWNIIKDGINIETLAVAPDGAVWASGTTAQFVQNAESKLVKWLPSHATAVAFTPDGAK